QCLGLRGIRLQNACGKIAFVALHWAHGGGGHRQQKEAYTLEKGGILRHLPMSEPEKLQPISVPSCPQRPLFQLYLRFPADSGQSLSAPSTSPSKDFQYGLVECNWLSGHRHSHWFPRRRTRES